MFGFCPERQQRGQESACDQLTTTESQGLIQGLITSGRKNRPVVSLRHQISKSAVPTWTELATNLSHAAQVIAGWHSGQSQESQSAILRKLGTPDVQCHRSCSRRQP